MSRRLQSITIEEQVKYYWVCLDCGEKNFVLDDDVYKVRCQECTQSFYVVERGGKVPVEEDFFDNEDEPEKKEDVED